LRGAGVELREATPGDVAAVLRLRRLMFEDMGYRDVAALEAMQRGSEALMSRGLADGSFRAWLAEDAGGRVVAAGAVVVSPWLAHPSETQPRRATILNLCTERDWRRRGIARRLMETMIGWCRREGFASVSLHASEDGRALYETLGFEPTSEMRLRLPKE
jgi:GNAT superfamily N-acetyltransferase